MNPKPSLDAAYDLKTPEDSVKLYRDWAETYDDQFAEERGYTYATEVARVFAAHASGDDRPVLDIGAGTGLVGAALHEAGIGPVDALDISQEMLDVAARKGIYKQLFCADLTAPAHFGAQQYGGLVSAGTFTHGHLGPEVLHDVVAMGKAGALFAIGINAEHYQSRGFEEVLSSMAPGISAPELLERPIYSAADADDPHGKDTALIAVFRKR